MKNSNTVPTVSDKLTTAAALAGSRIARIFFDKAEEPFRDPYLWKVEYRPEYSFADRWFASEEHAQAFAVEQIALEISEHSKATTPAIEPAREVEAPVQPRITKFAPWPIGPYEPASELPTGQSSVYGSCSTFCTTGHWDEGKPSGMEVVDHGQWCESQARGYVHGFSELGSPRESSVSLVKRYLHGTYDHTGGQLHQQPDEFVRIEIYEQGVSVFQFLPIGEAHRLGAALTALARSADSLDLSLDARS